MNIIDILILVVLTYAAYSGFREGLIVQVFSLVGIALSLWVGAKYSTEAADVLQLSGDFSKLLGFIIATVVVMIIITIAARALRQFFSFTGLRFVDLFFGVVLSIVKFTLMLSLVFTAVNLANQKYDLFGASELKKSMLYMPIANISNHFTPAWTWVNEQISTELPSMDGSQLEKIGKKI